MRDDPAYLAWLRTQPCVICRGNVHVEAAHLRVGSINDGKPYTGMQEKPSDRWALPLCSKHHREQHSMNELEFWASYNINPFEQCQKHQVKVRNPMPKFPFEKRKKEE